MKNLALTAEEARPEVAPSMPSSPKYPYGLALYLDETTLKKLGVKSLPGVGETLMIHAKVEVCSTNLSETQAGENRNLGLQITDMEIEKKKKTDKEIADKAYTAEVLKTTGKTFGKLDGVEKDGG